MQIFQTKSVPFGHSSRATFEIRCPYGISQVALGKITSMDDVFYFAAFFVVLLSFVGSLFMLVDTGVDGNI